MEVLDLVHEAPEIEFTFPIVNPESSPAPPKQTLPNNTQSMHINKIQNFKLITILEGNKSKQRECVVCKKLNAKLCGNCKTVAYCSRECQLSHWKVHKPLCKNNK